MWYLELARRIEESGLKKNAVAHEAGITPQYLSQILAGEPNVSPKTKEAVLKAMRTLATKAAGGLETPPDNPGVRELAADAELCRNHRVTPAELQELANLVAYRNGQQVTLRTAAEALAVLQSLRMLGPVEGPVSDGSG